MREPSAAQPVKGAHPMLARGPMRMRYARAWRARLLIPSIYDHTDPRPWLTAWVAERSGTDPGPTLRWLARRLELKVETLRVILRRERKLQPSHVAPLAEATGLDAEATEYLRLLVALLVAGPRDAGQAQRSVWAIYAVKQGVPPDEIVRLHRDAELRGPVELALLPALPLLAELPGVELDPEGLDPVLLLPPEPSPLAAVCAEWREGARAGRLDGARFCVFERPDDADSLDSEVWEGALELARHSLLAFPAEERDYHAMVWAVDEPGLVEADAALRRLIRALRRLVRRHAEAPLGTIYLLLCETHRVSEVLRSAGDHSRPSAVRQARRLRGAAKLATEAADRPGGPTTQEPVPCLYRFLEFQNYAQSWRAARHDAGDPCSYEWVGRRAGMLGSVCHNVFTGLTKLQPDHVPKLGKVLGFDADELAYLEGMSRYALATDLASRARERALLARYAAEHGHRTLDGERFRFLSDWVPQVIYELCALPCAFAQRSWIHYALRGRVHWEEAEDALKVLETLGLLDPATGRPRPAAAVNLPGSDEAERLALFRLHEQVLELLRRELLFPAPDQRASGLALALPDVAWPAARELVARYQSELHAACASASARARPDRVVIFATQLFPLARRR